VLDLTAQGAWEDLHRLRSPAGEPSMAGGEPSSAVDAGGGDSGHALPNRECLDDLQDLAISLEYLTGTGTTSGQRSAAAPWPAAQELADAAF